MTAVLPEVACDCRDGHRPWCPTVVDWMDRPAASVAVVEHFAAWIAPLHEDGGRLMVGYVASVRSTLLWPGPVFTWSGTFDDGRLSDAGNLAAAKDAALVAIRTRIVSFEAGR